MPKFRVEALVVGPVVPAVAVHAFDCHVEPIGESEWTLSRTLNVDVEAPAGVKATNITVISPLTGFRAYHRATLEVESGSADEAQVVADARLDRLVAALSLLAETDSAAPVAQVKRIVQIDPPGASTDGQVPVRVAGVVVATTQDAPQRMASLELLRVDDANFGELLDLRARAERSHREAFDSEARSRAVLAHALVMEAVARAVKGDLELGGDAELIAAVLALRDALTRVLDEDITEAKMAKNARKTTDEGWRKVQSVRLETAGQQMRAAGDELGLSDDEKQRGRDLWNLRSGGAGHPGGPDVTVEQVIAARRTADVYLRKYVDWRIDQRQNG